MLRGGAGPAFSVDGVRWWLGSAVGASDGRSLVEAAQGLLDAGALRNEKSGRRKALYRLALRGDEPDHLLKVNEYPFTGGWRRFARPSKARHELRLAEAASRRGIPTPLPVAAGELRRGGRLERCFLLVPIVPGARDLRALLAEGGLSCVERAALAAAWGTLTRKIHDAGLHQEDFAPNNFLLARNGPGGLYMIDFERARLVRHNTSRARRHMLAKLDRHMAGASLADRLRFLRAYGAEPEEARRWWRELEGAAAPLARRDLSHLRRTATRDGRRFRTVSEGGWQGFTRRETPLPDVLAQAERAATGSAVGDSFWIARAGSETPLAKWWSLAELLHRRGGLAPRPLAALARDATRLLVSTRDPSVRRLDDLAGAEGVRGALVQLLDRLLALGELDGELRPVDLALEVQAGRAVRAMLLDPGRLGIHGRPTRDRAARARREAMRLLEIRPPR